MLAMSMNENSNAIRVMLADSSVLFRCGIARLLESQTDIMVVGEAGNYRETLQLAEELRPDVVLVDVDLDGSDGPTLVELLHRQYPGMHIIFLGTEVEPDCLLRCVLAGASGYLRKNITPDQLFARIRGLCVGEAAMSLTTVSILMQRLSHSKCTLCLRATPHANLTPRECEVLVLVARGMTNKKIGSVLRISEHTVRNHLCSIYQKLNLENRLQVAVYSVTHGLININA
jgi:two-component system nitrate/nitrite response regulator NarL